MTKEELKGLYRIATQFCQNSIKHSSGNTLSIKLSNNPFSLELKDNGRGFDLTESTQGLGLEHMNLWAEVLDLDLQWKNTPKGGTYSSLGTFLKKDQYLTKITCIL